MLAFPPGRTSQRQDTRRHPEGLRTLMNQNIWTDGDTGDRSRRRTYQRHGFSSLQSLYRDARVRWHSIARAHRLGRTCHLPGQG
eukprot:8582494-Pyramimonas_sp.AAC.1